MKNLLLLLAAVTITASGCNSEVCRQCPVVEFDYQSFEPAFAADVIAFTKVSDGSTVEFTLDRTAESPEYESCSRDADEIFDIGCSSSAEARYTSSELGVDMSINFLELIPDRRGNPVQVIQSFSFKERAFSEFVRTHAIVLRPEIVLADDVVERRDSLEVDGELYLDVLELIQPEAAFEPLTTLPDAGRFVTINIKEDVGLLRLVDVNGNVYERDFQ